MPRVERGGLSGAAAKEVWLPAVLKQEHDAREAEIRALLPTGRTLRAPLPYSPPWTSLGQAPTEQNLKDESYGGSA